MWFYPGMHCESGYGLKSDSWGQALTDFQICAPWDHDVALGRSSCLVFKILTVDRGWLKLTSVRKKFYRDHVSRRRGEWAFITKCYLLGVKHFLKCRQQTRKEFMKMYLLPSKSTGSIRGGAEGAARLYITGSKMLRTRRPPGSPTTTEADFFVTFQKEVCCQKIF